MSDDVTPTPTPVKHHSKKAEADGQAALTAAFSSMLSKNPLAALAVALLVGGGGFGGFSLKQNTEETAAMRKSIEELRSEVVAVKSKVEVIGQRQEDNKDNIKALGQKIEAVQKDVNSIFRELRSSGLSLGTGAGNGKYFTTPPVDLSMRPGEGKDGFPSP